MSTSTFTFAKPELDHEFNARDGEIAQVVGNDGDGGIAHPLAGMTLPASGRAEPNH